MIMGFSKVPLYRQSNCLLLMLLLSFVSQVSARSYFLDNRNDTVTHATTRLMWQQVPVDTNRTFNQARAYCDGLMLGGHNDWRLPGVKELLSIVDYTRADPAVDPVVFDEIPTERSIWAESVFAGSTTLYLMNTYEGGLTKLGAPSETTRTALALCVRSGA